MASKHTFPASWNWVTSQCHMAGLFQVEGEQRRWVSGVNESVYIAMVECSPLGAREPFVCTLLGCLVVTPAFPWACLAWHSLRTAFDEQAVSSGFLHPNTCFSRFLLPGVIFGWACFVFPIRWLCKPAEKGKCVFCYSSHNTKPYKSYVLQFVATP